MDSGRGLGDQPGPEMTLEEKPMLFLEFHKRERGGPGSQFEMVQAVLQEHGASKVERGIGADERVRLWEVRHGPSSPSSETTPGNRSCSSIPACPQPLRGDGGQGQGDGGEGGSGRLLLGSRRDGNLHWVDVRPADSAAKAAVQRVNRRSWNTASRSAVADPGSTGWRGEAPFMEAEHGRALEYMRRIKKALDPKGILNPGKMLPE